MPPKPEKLTHTHPFRTPWVRHVHGPAVVGAWQPKRSGSGNAHFRCKGETGTLGMPARLLPTSGAQALDGDTQKGGWGVQYDAVGRGFQTQWPHGRSQSSAALCGNWAQKHVSHRATTTGARTSVSSTTSTTTHAVRETPVRRGRRAYTGPRLCRGGWGEGGAAKIVKRPPPQPAQPPCANYAAPLTRKRHHKEHRPQRPSERSDPTQHTGGRRVTVQGPVKKQRPDGISSFGMRCWWTKWSTTLVQGAATCSTPPPSLFRQAAPLPSPSRKGAQPHEVRGLEAPGGPTVRAADP